MAFWGNLEGTLKNIFSLGKGSTLASFQNSSGTLQVKNASSNAKNIAGTFKSDVSFDGIVTQKDVDVSANIKDARTADILLLDSSNNYERIFCKITATSASNVRINTNTALPAGTYRLIVVE